MAHIAHHDPTAAPAHIRAYLGQPHWLYVDIFADGTTKVGTVAQARLDSRLAEQGAFAAFYVARTADGYGIRRVEDAVSSAFGLRQAVPAKWKLRALEAAIDAPAHHAALARQLDLIRQYLTTLVGIDGLTVLDTAQPWQVPPCATAAFAAAPVMIYPADLTKGLHGLLLQAMTGSIGVFTTTDDPDAPRYATNLADLKGVQIELGNYQSPAYDEQPVLF